MDLDASFRGTAQPSAKVGDTYATYDLGKLLAATVANLIGCAYFFFVTGTGRPSKRRPSVSGTTAALFVITATPTSATGSKPA